SLLATPSSFKVKPVPSKMPSIQLALGRPLFLCPSIFPSDCGPPPKLNNAVPNEKLLGESFPHMKSVTYKCLDGFYNIYGKLDVVTCLSDSQWTPIEEFCERSCVDPPRSRFARINPKDIKTYYPAESKVSFTCRPGYNTIPEVGSTVTCFTNYTWTALPVFCEDKNVPPALFLFLRYKLKGSSSAQCLLQGDGVKWKPDPPKCQQITCFSPPNVAKASINGSSTGNFVYNSTVTYQCDDGFSLIGEASLRCTTEDNVNGWSRPPPECSRCLLDKNTCSFHAFSLLFPVVNCPRPSIPDGRLTSPFQPTYKYDHVLQFVCNAGAHSGRKSVCQMWCEHRIAS
uniref:Sushi domain-containing protein n=1 Tax=Anolis carolinensis TaxID=28377 RepID=A0A803TWF9_ANOCA